MELHQLDGLGQRLRGELFVERHLLHLKHLEGLSIDARFGPELGNGSD